jgi:hypothetical protein
MEFWKYRALMEYVKEKALALNHHELKYAIDNPDKRKPSLHNIVQTNFPINQTFDFKREGFAVCFNNRFYQTISLYEKCFRKDFKAFADSDAQNILQVLYDNSGYWRSIEDYIEYLLTESCCYVVLHKNDDWGDILRVDLFRKIDKRGDKFEFTGGLFHCLKHFSIDDRNLCGNADVNNTFDLFHIVYLLGRTFANAREQNMDEGFLTIDDERFYKAAFYREESSFVFFVKSLRKQRI